MLRDLLTETNPHDTLTRLDNSGDLGELFPYIAQLRMPIRSGYQHKDNLTHSIKVLQNAVERETSSPDLVLRTAALLHDIGKPGTRKFLPGGKVTFDGHEVYGARMVKKLLPTLGYSKTETEQVNLLVAYHMRSHGFGETVWTDSAVRRLIADVDDEQLMSKLVTIFYSDTTTRFPDKKARLHASVDRLVNKMEEVKKADYRKTLRPVLNGNQIMEKFGLTPGRELGEIMKYLNTDEGIRLTEPEVLAYVKSRLNK